MGLLRKPIGCVDVQEDRILHMSSNGDYIIISTPDGIESIGSARRDLTNLITKDITSNIRVLPGFIIKEHEYLKILNETHNLEDKEVYYILAYIENLNDDNEIATSFVFDNIDDCISMQTCLSFLSMQIMQKYWGLYNDNNNNE